MTGMMIRCLIYLAAALLSLSAFAVGLVEILFRTQVRPKLESNRATQEKVYQPYLEDLQFLERFALLRSPKIGTQDAGLFLNSKVYWAPASAGPSAAQPLVALSVREDLLRLRGDWLRKYNRAKTIKADLSIFTGLSRFDYWDIEQESPIGELIKKAVFVPPAQLPIPEAADLLTAVKLRLMSGALNHDFVNALKDVRDLARLLMTTENTQLVTAGLVALDHERFAYRFFVDEMKMPPGDWTPVDRNFTRRAHRSILATRSFLHLWTKPDKLEQVFLKDAVPVGLCAAANESFPLVFSLRRLLEPRWPMEMSLAKEYDLMNAIWKKTTTVCRVRYVDALNSQDAFRASIPGPLILNRLPYSRRIFGLRIAVMNFMGFEGYKVMPASMSER